MPVVDAALSGTAKLVAKPYRLIPPLTARQRQHHEVRVFLSKLRFMERKTTRELEYEQRVMSTRLGQYADPPNSPRVHSCYLNPQDAYRGLERSASG